MAVRRVTFEFREDIAAFWAAVNPILRAGEPGYETDTNKLKIGNGTDSWSALPYLTGSGGGADGKSAYEVAVDNGFVGTEAEWLVSLVGADGDPGPPGPPGETYPLSAYGFIAASVSIDCAQNNSELGSWVTRVWIPAGKTINKVGTFISIAGAAATSGENGFAIYTDAGDLVTSTPNDNDIWTNSGWVIRDLPSPIASEENGRYIRVGIALGNTSPWAMYAAFSSEGTDMLQGGVLTTHRRAWAVSDRNSGWPTTIDVVNEGTSYSYIPIIVLA